VFDIGVTKLAIIGGIALIVIGPEKLPGLARTFGTMLGRARRYVADVKEEVNRSMDLDELRKAQASLQEAAQAVQSSIDQSTAAIENAPSAAAFDAHFTDQPIADPQAIHLARTDAKPGDEIVIHGLIMGRGKVFVDGRASFLLGDREKLTPCNTIPGDECETPWDCCCDSKEAKREGIASIQIIDAEGKVLSGGLKGVKGLKELSAVTVSGTV
jgi:sec-independent protein translocase protein TatB